MKEPTLTLFIPSFNRADLLDQTLQSVAMQTKKPFEVLIMDNASTDETDTVVARYKKYGFIYVKHPKNIGMIENWNSGIRQAKGEYFAMLHSDDLIAPNWYETWIDTISHKKADFYTSAIVIINKDNVPLYTCHIFKKDTAVKQPYVMSEMGVHGAPIIAPTGATVYSKKIFDRIGLFNPQLKTEADVEFCMKLFDTSDLFYLDKIVFAYRAHPEQTFEEKREAKSSSAKLTKLENYFSIIRDFYDKKYKGNPKYRSFYVSHCFMTLSTINLYSAKLEFEYVFKAQKLAKKYFPDLYTKTTDWITAFNYQIIFLKRALFGKSIPIYDKKQISWLTTIHV